MMNRKFLLGLFSDKIWLSLVLVGRMIPLRIDKHFLNSSEKDLGLGG